MKFEIVDFYPTIRNPKWGKAKTGWKPSLGTVHVYWIDQGIDLRGILALISPRIGIYYHLPFSTNFDPVSGKVVRYPIFSFTNPQMAKELEDFLKTNATPLVEKYLKEHPKCDKRLKNNEVTNEKC